MESGSAEEGPGRVRAFLDRWLAPYLPYPHFMAFAPLDVVLQLLLRPRATIPPAYWPRLVLLLLISTIATITTLPERTLIALWLRWRPPPIPPHQAPIFVLGYFRSGTTFLHNLLAADPKLRAPRWAEVLVPQTFAFGWTIFRYLFIPFIPLARMDRIAPAAPAMPAEDDFALNNWGLVSILAGRAVLPQRQHHFDRYHDLDALTPRERDRWRACQRAFVQKLVLVSGGRRLVLKSPSHTARIRYLLEMFPGAKFVHISRPPEVVFQSNVFLVRTLQRAFALQHPLSDDEQAERIAGEYLATEQRYLADRALIPPGNLAEVRLRDLSADPVGEMKRIYRELGLPFSAQYEAGIGEVAASLGRRSPNRHPEPTVAQRALAARLAPLAAAFGYEHPAAALAGAAAEQA